MHLSPANIFFYYVLYVSPFSLLFMVILITPGSIGIMISGVCVFQFNLLGKLNHALNLSICNLPERYFSDLLIPFSSSSSLVIFFCIHSLVYSDVADLVGFLMIGNSKYFIFPFITGIGFHSRRATSTRHPWPSTSTLQVARRTT